MAKKTTVIEKPEVVEEVKEVKEIVQAVVVNCTKLNLRKAASTNADILDTIENGEWVTVIKANKEWTKVEYKGTTGFVMNEYIAL